MSNQSGTFRPWVSSLRGAAIYALFGLLWIYFSDTVLGALVSTPERLTAIQTYKGCFYIAITAALIYWLLQRHGFAIEKSKRHVMDNETSLNLLFRALPLGVGTVKERVITSANDRLCEISGYSKEEIIGQDTSKFYVSHAEYERVGKIIYGETARTGRCFLDARWRRKDGRELDVLIGAAVTHEDACPTDVVVSVMDITEQRQREQMYRVLFESFPIGVTITDENGNIIEVNKESERLLGVVAEEHTRTPLTQEAWQIVGPNGRDLPSEEIPALIALRENRAVRDREIGVGRRDGSRVWLSVTAAPIPLEGYGVAVGYIDVSLRKLAEKNLRESEERFKALHNASFGGIAIHDKGIILDCNQGLSDISGYSLDELTGMDGLQLIAEQFRGLVMDNIQSEYEEPYEAMGVRKNGEEYPLRLEGRMIPYQGRTVRVVEFRDITEGKRTLKALQKNEAYMNSIFRCMPTGIGVVKNRVVITANDRFCEILGYPREEILGREARTFYASEEEYQRCGQELYDEMDRYGYGSIETVARRKDGQEVHLLINSAPLPPDEGERVNTLSIMDITERKRNEEALRMYKDELEEMVRDRTEELATSNSELQRMIKASDDRSEQTTILNEMGELLQASETEEETYRVAAGVCAKLFPGDSGCLGILDEDKWNINVVGSWGQGHSCNTEFAHNDCWAIRRGKAHLVLEPDTDPLCRHVREPPKSGTLCVPMNAQGKVLGIAHMRFDDAMKDFKAPERLRIMHEKRLLLRGLVERYAPSLVNLRLRESLREQSIRDRLTGLFNRRHMESTLTRELARARRQGASLVLIMIDVDHFKRFNDSYGHETGDEVLRRLGGFLTSTVRMEDIPCRYGGEELMLILPECSLKDGLVRAEDVRKGIETDITVVHDGKRLQVTASLGVASFPLDGESMESLITAVDKALYRAKDAGRNRVASNQRPN